MAVDYITVAFCADYDATFEVPSSRGDTTYTVTWAETGGYCTCRSFTYSADRHCKHIDQVWEQACFRNPQWYDGGTCQLRPTKVNTTQLIPGAQCPRCGGPEMPVAIAV